MGKKVKEAGQGIHGPLTKGEVIRHSRKVTVLRSVISDFVPGASKFWSVSAELIVCLVF